MNTKSKDVSIHIQKIEEILTSQNYSHFGFAELKTPTTIAFYQSWIEQEYYGEMSYLKDHLPFKESPQKAYPFARSAIVVAAQYLPHPEPLEKPSSLRVAQYAKGQDYHHWLKAKLHQTIEKLQRLFPNEQFLPMTDSSPLLERDLAHQAGLGWYGKNTCLIHPQKGSFFLLGEILTSLELHVELKPIHDFCGNCTRCIDVCPTNAIIEPHKLDATQCISYHTIESRKTPPLEIAEQIGDWFFGCDLCQTVCPWNQKVFGPHLRLESSVSHPNYSSKDSNNSFQNSAQSNNSSATTEIIDELRFLLTASGKKIEKNYQGTPLKRAGPFGLRRNAIIVTANLKLTELKPEIKKMLTNPRYQELAKWALDKLENVRK